MQRTVIRHRGALFPQLLLACLVFVPHLSRAQGCEWESLPAPSADVDVIEVPRYGGYGEPAGRTLVRVDVSGEIVWLAHGQCPDRALVGRLTTPTFDDLEDEFRRVVASIRSQPPPLCQSPEDGVDLDVTLYHDGSNEHHRCVTGGLLRFGENVLELVADAMCASRPTRACVQRMVGQP